MDREEALLVLKDMLEESDDTARMLPDRRLEMLLDETDGDVRRAMERLKADFFNIRARDIATPHPKTIGAGEKLIEAERVMTRNKITSLLVTGDDGRLTGVIQIYDIKL